ALAALALALAALAAGAPARAGNDADAQAVQQDLYQEALQSIAEGRQADASRTLAQMIAQGPANAGEWLDLGMLQCALGHSEEAEQIFRSIETRFDPPKGIRDIIAGQRSQGCYVWVAHSQWSVTAARGDDRNVNQGASNPLYAIGGGAGGTLELLPEYLPQADRYSVLSADYLRDLDQNGTLGFAQLYARRNDHLSHYDTISAYGGVERAWRFKRWQVRGTAGVGALTLGGQMYQKQFQLQARVTPPLRLPQGMDWTVLGGLTHMGYQSLSNFDSNTVELRNTLGYRGAALQGQLWLGWQRDRALGERPGGDRQGWSAGAYARGALWRRLEGELEGTAQRWRGAAAYSPGLIDEVRHQRTGALRAALLYPLGRNSTVQLEWRQVRNRENISLFQYNNRQLQLSWRWQDGR
ncbi:tetratricopeptide repeat protein, partial [Burkholderia sp. LMU1-1-1.1]|uniref:tetratricopeptide repeat protein n=1 Tax=Burkholderia sp. LMU1-1-1.1 TaxID=3135266 RepID=UPI00344689F1